MRSLFAAFSLMILAISIGSTAYADCPPSRNDDCDFGCQYYTSRRQVPSQITWTVRGNSAAYPNVPVVSGVYYQEETGLYLLSRGFEENNEGFCREPYSRYIGKSAEFDGFVSVDQIVKDTVISDSNFTNVYTQYDVRKNSSSAFGSHTSIVDLQSSGVIDDSDYVWWSSAGVNQRTASITYLARTSSSEPYDGNVRVDLTSDISIARSKVFQGIYCDYDSRVPLSSYRLIQRITVQALDQYEDPYCTFRVQGGAFIGTTTGDSPRVQFVGWLMNNYSEDSPPQNDCIDPLTNEVISTSKFSEGYFDYAHENVDMCYPQPVPNDQYAYLTLVVPGEPFAVRVEVVNQILPVLSRIPSSNFDIDPEAFFGGDLNGSGRTKPADFDYLLSKYGYTIDDLFDYEPECDLNGDGVIDDDDIELFETYFCLADYNGDGTVDVSDLLDFLDDYSNLDIEADMNEDSVVDILDYLDFSNYYSSGC